MQQATGRSSPNSESFEHRISDQGCITAKCVTWATHRSAPVLGRSKLGREERLADSMVSDLRTLLWPGTAALRRGSLSRSPLGNYKVRQRSRLLTPPGSFRMLP